MIDIVDQALTRPSLLGIGKDAIYAVALRYLECWNLMHGGQCRRHDLEIGGH